MMTSLNFLLGQVVYGFFQSQITLDNPDRDNSGLIIAILLVTNILSPILVALANKFFTKNKDRSETDKQDTENAILKINKLNELINQIREVELRYIELSAIHRQLKSDHQDLREEVWQIFDIVFDIDDERLNLVKYRIQKLKMEFPDIDTSIT